MKKEWTRLAVAIGPLLVVSTWFWELARMNPGYPFLIEPWAIRGSETVHGALFVALGVGLLVGALYVAWDGSTASLTRALIGVAWFVVAATVVAGLFATEPLTFRPNELAGFLVAVVLGLVAWRLAVWGLNGRVPFLERGSARTAGAVGAIVVAYLVLQTTVVERSVTLPLPMAVGGAFLVLGALTVSKEPRKLAANRMLLYASLVGWVTVTVSAGALRSTLLDRQLELLGLTAQYRDTQVSYGWFVAGAGMLVLFVGTVGLWAHRRDQLLALHRAQEQRRAAEESAREIREALERYEATRAGAAS